MAIRKDEDLNKMQPKRKKSNQLINRNVRILKFIK